jgi:hypothetical protein
MLAQTERYLKQAIVDKEPYVASAALVSGVHLMKASPAGVDIVRYHRILSCVMKIIWSSRLSVGSARFKALSKARPSWFNTTLWASFIKLSATIAWRFLN